jgi:hypothetical protein
MNSTLVNRWGVKIGLLEKQHDKHICRKRGKPLFCIHDEYMMEN